MKYTGPRVIYLHGFASGPSSKKAQYFRRRFEEAGVSLEVPDLAEGDFEHLTITGQLRVIERLARDEGVSLMGSSLGGYLAALYAARHSNVQKVVLMAPAFSFSERFANMLGEVQMETWKRDGAIEMFHYGAGHPVPLRYGLMEDARHYEEYPDFPQPALVFQGLHDTAVPASLAQEFARRHSETDLRLLDSDHELLNVLPEMWEATDRFLLKSYNA